jgi:hypothetical protein
MLPWPGRLRIGPVVASARGFRDLDPPATEAEELAGESTGGQVFGIINPWERTETGGCTYMPWLARLWTPWGRRRPRLRLRLRLRPMFVIASSGRCGTMAVCHGLDRFSDHRVEHEPEPRLLEEAQMKHQGNEYRTATFEQRMAFFRRRSDEPYGQSFRAPNLLEDVQAASSRTRFLVIVRDPLEYAVSAHDKRVLRRGDVWDSSRLMPIDPSGAVSASPLAERLIWHWFTVNRYLLDFAVSAGPAARVVLLSELREDLGGWADHLGVRITEPTSLRTFLTDRPNAREGDVRPDGWDLDRLGGIYSSVWERAVRLAS